MILCLFALSFLVCWLGFFFFKLNDNALLWASFGPAWLIHACSQQKII